jgi:hypothetical protein
MNPPDLKGIPDAWRRASDADVARALAEPTDYEPAVVAIIQAEADRRGTMPASGAAVPRRLDSVNLRLILAVARFFRRHRFLAAILLGFAYQRASDVAGPLLQPFVHTTTVAIAINAAFLAAFAFAIGVLCVPLRTYRTVLAVSAFAILGGIGAGIPRIVPWVVRNWSQPFGKPYLAIVLVSPFLLTWAAVCLVLCLIVFLHNRYRPIIPAGHCPKCGYNLFGLPEPRCPECGKPFEPQDVKTGATV